MPSHPTGKLFRWQACCQGHVFFSVDPRFIRGCPASAHVFTADLLPVSCIDIGFGAGLNAAQLPLGFYPQVEACESGSRAGTIMPFAIVLVFAESGVLMV
jgi:hypothetical protein